MTAVLLARTTHRSGILHVSAFGDDFGEGKSSQSAVVDGVYRSALESKHAKFKQTEDAGEEALTEYMTKGEGKSEDERTRITAAVAAAIQATYRWMARHMNARLPLALLAHEAPYYQTLAKQRDAGAGGEALHDPAQLAKESGYSVELAQMNEDLQDVAKVAIDQNEIALQGFGFFK